MKLIYMLFLAVLFASPLYAGDLKSDISQQSEAFAKAYNAHDFRDSWAALRRRFRDLCARGRHYKGARSYSKTLDIVRKGHERNEA